MKLRDRLLACAAPAFVAFGFASPAQAQEGDGAKLGEETAIPPLPQSPEGAQSYTPDFFTRFAPRNALDMVGQIPGFRIEGDNGGGGQRGLGEASANVLLNGKRFSSKSESVRDQLQRIPAGDVVRIDIVEGTTLDIPGLSGQVANVIVQSGGALSGQFKWRPAFREMNADPLYTSGEISLSGTTGPLDFTLSLSNQAERFGGAGPVFVRDGAGGFIRDEDIDFRGRIDKPTLSANLAYGLGGDAIARLNLSYARVWYELAGGADIVALAGDNREDNLTEETGYEYEISPQLELPLGPGQLKLIGLERFDTEDRASTLTNDFIDPLRLSTGGRFTGLADIGERIGRAEYAWPMWGGDWQVSGEAAFNRLDNVSRLFDLDAAGRFVEIDFPAGTGGVREDRYETILSHSRQLSSSLGLQVTGGAEFSTLRQTGVAANERSFVRPKGSAQLAWTVSDRTNLTFELRRSVGQLSFGDFLASVNLDQDNTNAGNNELVPTQETRARLEWVQKLGPLGQSTLELSGRWFEDALDFIPLPGGGEARGNFGTLTIYQLDWRNTFELAAVGLPGVRLDTGLELDQSIRVDPVTGESRGLSGGRYRELSLGLRHDVPRTDWAWGADLYSYDVLPRFRVAERNLGFDGPTFMSVYAEHKDVFGLTVSGRIANVLGGSDFSERIVYAGPRGTSPVLFTERSDRDIGLIFRFEVAGSF